jgi:two-component system, NarL family, nitrate/nitrite response regulator NarL
MSTAAHKAVAPAKQRDYTAGAWAIRVFLVGDVCVYRESLANALANDGRIEVAGASPGDIATMAANMAEPAVVLVDTSAEGGPERVRTIASAVPTARIVAVGIDDREDILLELAEAGAIGFVTAEQPLDELVEAIEAAANGELRCSPRVSAALAERLAALRAGSRRRAGGALTRREREIAALIAEGLSNKQIAGRLSIERATVKNHVHNILGKLGVTHRYEVASLL